MSAWGFRVGMSEMDLLNDHGNIADSAWTTTSPTQQQPQRTVAPR